MTIGSVRPATQTATFASRVEAVRVDVLVTSRGRPVRDLRAAEFEVLDNGVPGGRSDQLRETPLNALLVLDMSASVAGGA